MFVGPDFNGHHFKASDAHTWENKTVLLIPNLKPRPDFKTFETHVKHSKGSYAVMTQICAVITPIYAATWECFVFACVYFC